LLVHRLVLETFVGSCPEGMEGCHGDGDKTNNALLNLRWDTPKSNTCDRIRHGTKLVGEMVPGAKLSSEFVITVRDRVLRGESQASISRETGIHPATIGSICQRVTWKHL
jgi:hypothetical protein